MKNLFTILVMIICSNTFADSNIGGGSGPRLDPYDYLWRSKIICKFDKNSTIEIHYTTGSNPVAQPERIVDKAKNPLITHLVDTTNDVKVFINGKRRKGKYRLSSEYINNNRFLALVNNNLRVLWGYRYTFEESELTMSLSSEKISQKCSGHARRIR